MIELRGIHRQWDQGTQHAEPHVVISLLGRFKNEIRECYHLMPVLVSTPRGLEPGKWVHRVLESYAQHNIRSGYMFRNVDGTKLKIKTMEPKFLDRLCEIKMARRDLIDPEVEVSEDYGVSRSFRWGGTLEATNQGAPPQVIALNGRWRKSNQSGASKPNVTIREHYTDIRLVLEFSRFL